MPDAVIKSKLFFDSRVRTKSISGSVSQGGSAYQSWLDFESGTSKMSPDYDRERCISIMIDHGYPPPLAAFYCD